MSTYYTQKKIKESNKNNKFKNAGTTSDGEFGLPGGFYSVLKIHDYFKYITKNHEKLTDKS